MLTPDQEKMREAAKAADKDWPSTQEMRGYREVTPPAAILALLDQVEALQADKARMDFASTTVIDGQGDQWYIDQNTYFDMSLRQTLDAAMAAEPLPPPPEAACPTSKS